MGVLTPVVEYIYAQVLLVFLCTCALHTQALKNNDSPLTNNFPHNWSRKKARAVFVRDSQGLKQEGFKKVRRITSKEPINFSSRCAPVQRPVSHHHATGFEGDPSDRVCGLGAQVSEREPLSAGC